MPAEKAFYFYADVGKPLGVYAVSLGDFEVWFVGLDDAELAKKTALIRERKMFGEELRGKLYEVVKSHCEELAKIKQ